MSYLIKRGRRAVRGTAHAHLARYNQHGRIVGPWCPAVGLDLESNVPWGLKICRHCIRKSRAA